MSESTKGFTLIELMIVVVIIGVLAAIAIPNFIAMQDRAKEGSTKANMHTFQLAAEDYNVQNGGAYSADIAGVAPLLPGAGANLKNPFNSANPAMEDGGAWAFAGITMTATPGLIAYQDSVQQKYQIRGQGKSAIMPLILSSGQ